MTLREKQSKLVDLIAGLIRKAQILGFELTLGEAFRSPEEAERLAKLGLGITHSLHTQRLAIDLNLFINGEYQSETAAYLPLGEWWENQSMEDFKCCWGGRFTRADGNHFSIEHEGRQ
jgi:hypothetical protein